jgi:hypothetical protein
MNGDAMNNNKQEPRPCPQETEPFAKCQRCQKREADLTTRDGKKVCANCATPTEVANGNAA